MVLVDAMQQVDDAWLPGARRLEAGTPGHGPGGRAHKLGAGPLTPKSCWALREVLLTSEMGVPRTVTQKDRGGELSGLDEAAVVAKDERAKKWEAPPGLRHRTPSYVHNRRFQPYLACCSHIFKSIHLKAMA